tara:strand:- start:4300 stop:4710 length:411 start_codon:yes stop_codon:yes gene_type:complete
MEKTILAPKNCGDLRPDAPYLRADIIKRLNSALTKESIFNPDARVLDVPPILVTNDGHIINGKHRASWAYHNGFNLEAYIAENINDIQDSIPSSVYDDVGLLGILHLFRDREFYFSECMKSNIRNISDLVRKYIES